jgi:hypothetical protein
VKAILLNDTSNGHAGSVAASWSIIGVLRRAGYEVIHRHLVGETRPLPEKAVKRADLLLVNGEGTMHKGRHADRLVAQMKAAQDAGLKVALVNTLLDEEVAKQLRCLKLSFLAARDPLSVKAAAKLPGACHLLTDSCADPRMWEGGEPLCDLPPVVRGFTHPSSRCANVLDKHDYVRFGLHAPFRDVVATLATCQCYLTGQHHGVYAAALAGIPFVPIPSNTHKIGALIRWSGFPIPIAKTHEEVKDHSRWAIAHPGVFREFRQWLISRPYLTADHLRPLAGRAASPAG